LGVGVATLDIVNYVAGYPEEDSEVRALRQRKSRGGNVTNTLTVLSRLGHGCSWAGMSSNDAASDYIREELLAESIGIDYVTEVKEASLPTSYITLNTENGSRSIIHFRDLPEYSFESFEKINLDDFDWVHFEGRNIPELEKMMRFLHANNFQHFSLETEKPREGIEVLFNKPAALMFSRDYVRSTHKGVKDFFEDLRQDGIEVPLYCAWGKAGGWAMDGSGKLFQQPAWVPENLVDTLGAGDAFNAGVIDRTLQGLPANQVLEYACKIAGFKCGLNGFNGIEKVVDA
jgi:ketohexokinase